MLLSGGLANVGSVKGGEGLVNMEKIVRRMDCSITPTHTGKVIAWVQTSEGPGGSSATSITDYGEPHKN